MNVHPSTAEHLDRIADELHALAGPDGRVAPWALLLGLSQHWRDTMPTTAALLLDLAERLERKETERGGAQLMPVFAPVFIAGARYLFRAHLGGRIGWYCPDCRHLVGEGEQNAQALREGHDCPVPDVGRDLEPKGGPRME